MAHFAKINADNIVENVLVVPDEQEHRGEEYLNELGLEGRWIQTSYNNNIRKKFAGIGYTFDGENFRPAEPEGNLGFDEETWSWIMPEPEVTEEETNA